MYCQTGRKGVLSRTALTLSDRLLHRREAEPPGSVQTHACSGNDTIGAYVSRPVLTHIRGAKAQLLRRMGQQYRCPVKCSLKF